jgi:PAS domain S-box-containing protein
LKIPETTEVSPGSPGSRKPELLDSYPPILLVDDQPARHLTYEAMLANLQVVCVRAASGEEALQRLLKQDFAAVLLDVHMPGMDGLEVARLIRGHPRLARTPIIFVTGAEVSALEQLKGYEAGAIDYISVPIVPEILRSKVAVLCVLYQRQRELEELNRALHQARSELDTRHADEIAHQEQLYEAILTNTPDLAYVFGLDHRFIYANDSLLKMWGKDREEAIGKTCLELGYPTWHAEMHDREIDQIIATKLPIRGEVAFTGPLGRRDYDYLLVPVLGAEEKVVAVAGTTRDITERKQMEAALRDADHRKDEFIAMLAHELRNPVAPIRNAAEILSRVSADERVVGIADILKRQTGQLSRLLDDLLEVARITQGRIILKREIVAVQVCVQMAVEAVEPMIKERHQQLSVTHDGLSIYVNADKARLTQCIANLLTNAAKFTPAQGDICVNARIEGDQAVIEVIDTGIGISADFLPQVFDLFVQGQRSLDRSEGGLGIGLSVVKQLIEMHGGRVSGSSNGAGKGAMFAIYLPLAGEKSASQKTTFEASQAKLRILVVDDNVDAANSMASLLEFDGHLVKAVYSAEDALAESSGFEPDFILLDIGLPRISGYEVVRRIKAANPQIRVVALSGYGRSEDREQATAAGFDAHLVKPVDFDVLRELFNRSWPEAAFNEARP